MPCVYKYNGVTYDKDDFTKILLDMNPAEASKYMPGVSSVPDAPFVGKTQAYVMLAMRKIVRLAAEENFDTVAWTQGAEQADRYDLSKQISQITYQKESDGEYTLFAYPHQGESIEKTNLDKDGISDFVGKEIAEKIVTSEKDSGKLQGLDLKVGGEGMIGFYDKILPNVVNKFFNKKAWGKAKVGEIDLIKEEYERVVPDWENYLDEDLDDDQIEDIKKNWTDENNNLLLDDGAEDYTDAFVKEWGSAFDVDELLSNLSHPSKGIKLHALPITPEMKSKALREGMPLFQTQEDRKTPLQKLTEEYWGDKPDYKANRKSTIGLKTKAKVNMSIVLEEIGQYADEFLGSISTRLGNINPKLKAKIRKLSFDTETKSSTDYKKVEPLLKKAKASMNKNDYADWDYARKNSDVEKINELIKKHGLEKEYAEYRKVLDDLRKEGLDSGLDIGLIEEYAPRVLKDKRGFLTAIGKGKDWDVIQRMLKQKADDAGMDVSELTLDQRADAISNMIVSGHYGLGGVGATKERKIKTIPAELNKYYMDSDAALVQHIYSMRKAIEARKFFGKIPKEIAKIKQAANSINKKIRELEKNDPKNNQLSQLRADASALNQQLERYKYQRDYQDNIGVYVDELLIRKEIKPEDQRALIDILNARFHEQGTRGIVRAYKNLSYIDTMGSFISAITQIGDTAWAMYETGAIPALKHAYKAVVGKSQVTKEDVGIQRIAQEFEDSGTLGKAVNFVFKWVGLEKIDSIGKEALLNSSLERYQKMAKSNPAKLKMTIKNVFEGETNGVIKDLLNKDITENVKLLVYSRLLDFQPVALSEMPQKYLSGGNGRLFYMLKTFTIKVFDVYRNEVFKKINSPDKATKIQGLKNLVRLSMFFVLMNAGADELKDFFLGRKTDLSDRVVDNILRIAGISKFVTWKARTEGVGSAMAKQILPPFKFIDSLTKDIVTAGDEKGLQTISSIPFAGKIGYWHFGRGRHKRSDLWDRRLSKEKKRLKKVKDQLDKTKNKRKFKIEHRKELTRYDRINKFQGKLNTYRSRINKLKSRKETSSIKKRISALEEQRTNLIIQYLKRKN